MRTVGTSNGRSDRGFTLLELLVVIAIVALLVAILVPSVSNALSLANAVICGNNLREIHKSLALRTLDEGPMRAIGWTNTVLKHVVESTLICPEDGEVGGGDWDLWDENGDGRPSFARHLGRFNVLTVGGQVERRHPDDINPDPALFPGSREAHWTP